MLIHNLKNGMYKIKFKGLDGFIITSSWEQAIEIAWTLGSDK